MKKKVILISILLILLIGGGIYLYLTKNNRISLTSHNPCLGDNEIADYQVKEEKNIPSSALVLVKSKNTNKQIFEFQIDNITPNHYHGYEVYRCGVYAVREFNFDYKKNKTLPDFRMEIWKYDYGGTGQKLTEENDFRVSPDEKYLVLEKGYLGQDDYSLVIKDLKTTNDLFILKFNGVIKEHPKMLGTFGMLKWTDDSRYFWAEVFDGAYTKGFIRTDSQNWSYEIFELPNDMDIGVSGPLNFNTGYTILYPGLVWTGVVEVDEQIKEQWREEGQLSKMYLYNIFTKEKILIATTSEPLYDFNAQWLSDTELQYEMPSGEKRVYKIEN